MTSIPEQLSAARKSQLDAQFRLLHSFTDRAFDNASRVMALNLALSRESVERSSRTFSQLLGATSPRDLGLLRSHAEEQMRSVAAYGRELFGIALGIQPYSVPLTTPAFTPAALPAPTQVAQTIIEASAPAAKAAEDAVQAGANIIEAVASTATDTAAVVAHAVDPVEETLSALVQEQALKGEPAVVQSLEAEVLATPVDEPAPVAKPKPIAKAAGKGAPKAAVAAHPLAAPVENQDSATVTRIDAGSPKRRK
ncbi:phasin family protein [Massilia sp. YIM B02443]|uniref:phasin family protein n=1 Tax=Massilia sp. YIM B02443 TaxID=3050127 RepID=UPI0025B6D7C3|nr:phasin family protein [Massilia sp. YIM B02443]MDN4035566.1 phasin family protein [Massilia sp. YIM B02443]